MNQTEILKMIQDHFTDLTMEWLEPEKGDKYLIVPHDRVDEVVTYLKETWELSFDYLMNLSAFDAKEHIELAYHLHSYRHRHDFILKVKAVRENGEVNTITNLYGTANYQEREVYDHFGVRFKGHPNLKRILLPEDWVGHPLLKDYKEQEVYDQIATTRESLLDIAKD